VSLHLHVAPLNVIERGVLTGQFQIGVVPGHRSTDTLVYQRLFDETMFLYCAPGHPLFALDTTQQPANWDALHQHRFAGLGYHSPNMALTQQVRLARAATGYDQESIATLILSGRFLGFLPDHYAQEFVRQDRMRALQPGVFSYRCSFFGIVRASPQSARVTRAFQDCLLQAHPESAARSETKTVPSPFEISAFSDEYSDHIEAPVTP